MFVRFSMNTQRHGGNISINANTTWCDVGKVFALCSGCSQFESLLRHFLPENVLGFFQSLQANEVLCFNTNCDLFLAHCFRLLLLHCKRL